MLKLAGGILELLRKVATSLPADVEGAIRRAYEQEPQGSASREALFYILENVRIARASARPICQDTGTPVFYVEAPRGLDHSLLADAVTEAVRRATERVPLRANAVDVLTERNSGDNTGLHFPEIYIRQSPGQNLTVELALRGAGSENWGTFYRLPDEALRAERDLEGVRRCVLDALWRAQGRGCPPYVVGVGIAGTRAMAARLSREALLRRLDDENQAEVLRLLEASLLKEINQMGIGPLGLGGRCTALAVKVNHAHRHTGSYFVDVSLSCWALRRGKLIW
jgi:fumarate hydratase class I